MTTRTRSDTVEFLHPFEIAEVDGTQPAGRYLVETDEELLHGISFIVYRRLATYIHLPGPLGDGELNRVVAIDPVDLAATLAADTKIELQPAGVDLPLCAASESCVNPLPGRRDDQAVATILVATRDFRCIGASPPDDHPHVYIHIGDEAVVLCPYCAAPYRFDPLR